MEIHGWSSVALDTPWSISVLTVALLNEGLKVSSRLQLCFFRYQTVLMCTAMDALFLPAPLTPPRLRFNQMTENTEGNVFLFSRKCAPHKMVSTPSAIEEEQ